MSLKPVRQQLKHYHRYAGYDYSRGASLFITLSTDPRQRVFGDVIDGKMALNDLGREVDRSISFTFSTAPDMVLYRKKVLPDHCHFRFYLKPGHETTEAIGLINHAIGRFKSYTTKLYHSAGGAPGPFWQEGCHDWLCMNRQMIDAVDRYIDYNDLKWFLRHKLLGALKLYEPIYSPRFENGDYWRGVGEIGFLADERPMISFRGGHKMSPNSFAKVVEAFRRVAADHTIISGFISPVEREVYRALSEMEGAQLVKVLPCSMYHDYQPGVEWLPAIKARRLAIIARGNSPSEFNRRACLDLNATIIPIAKRNGRALWWQSDGRFTWL